MIRRSLATLLLLLMLLSTLTSCFLKADDPTAATKESVESSTDEISSSTTVATEEVSKEEEERETSAESDDESTQESLNVQSVVQGLKKLGLSGFDGKKLAEMEFYYENCYIGELPNIETLTRETKDLFEFYFSGNIDQSDEAAMTDAVLTCYQIATGDPYGVYLNEKDFQDFNTDMDAEYSGIGVYVNYDAQNNIIQVLAAYEGTPASQAGILPGDYIVAVDGIRLADVGYYELINLIRGEIGTSVTVTILRDDREMNFTMLRQQVSGVSVTSRLLTQDETIGYVKIEQFDHKTFEQFKEAVDGLIFAGAEGLIFDLRNNPGGEVDAIIDVLDYLLPDGRTIASFRYADALSKRDVVYESNDGHSVTLPMTVLCNEYTASAGELFTATLQDYGAATVIGTTTYGKGTAQVSVLFSDEKTAFTISVARYDPPLSENYEGVGVEPDIVEELNEDVASVNIFLRNDMDDNQLQRAVKEINRLRNEVLQ